MSHTAIHMTQWVSTEPTGLCNSYPYIQGLTRLMSRLVSCSLNVGEPMSHQSRDPLHWSYTLKFFNQKRVMVCLIQQSTRGTDRSSNYCHNTYTTILNCTRCFLVICLGFLRPVSGLKTHILTLFLMLFRFSLVHLAYLLAIL